MEKTKTNMEQLKKMLILLEDIVLNNHHWNLMMAIVSAIKENNAQVLHKEWTDSFKVKFDYPLELDKMETWSTFEELVRLKFFMKDGGLICDAEVHEGSTWGGPSRPRFKATISLSEAFIQNIDDRLTGAFALRLGNEYEDHLEQKRFKWMEERGRDVLGSKDFSLEPWR
jgi:hypothetical protein